MVDERADLVAPFAQRRDVEPDDVQAVEEIFAEAPLADGGFEVRVGGGDDAHIDDRGSRFADRCDFAGFEEAEQLRLQLEAEFADFVEEEGAVAGAADDAGVVAVGAGEGAAPMAEQMALERSRGMAAQLKGTNGLAARSEYLCTARASTSLPVPLSPVMSTVM